MTSITEILGAVGSNRNWEIISPVDSAHEAILENIGPKVGRTIQGEEFNYPTAAKRDEDGALWVCNYFQQIHRMTDMLEVDYSPIPYALPSLTEAGTRDCLDFTLDSFSNGTKVIITPSYGRLPSL